MVVANEDLENSWSFGVNLYELVLCVPGVQMRVCNREHYGFLPVPLKPQQNVEDESESFIHTITETLSE